MRLVVGVFAAVAVLVAFSTNPGLAKPKSKTKYTYYTISGNSARNLYQQMISRGPHVGRDRALAATSVVTRQSGELVGKSGCQVRNYRLNLDFTINLPRVKNEKSLSPRLRKRWKAFYQFVRRHEHRHRSIWIGCAAKIESQVRRLKAGSCRELDAKANKIFQTFSTACEKQHDAFDRAEQKRLARHPLVVAAKRVPRKSNKLAQKRRKAQTKKRKVRAFKGSRAYDEF